MNVKFDAAAHALKRGTEYAYDRNDEGEAQPAADWAHEAARGILYDLTDRKGIKHGFQGVDCEVRTEIIQSLAEIIRRATPPSPSTAPTDEAGERNKLISELNHAAVNGYPGCAIISRALASRPVVEAAGLPALPAAQAYVSVWDSTAVQNASLQSANQPYFTADQMRAYGQECASAALAAKPAKE